MADLGFYSSKLLTASLSDAPTTPGQIELQLSQPVGDLSEDDFVATFAEIRTLSHRCRKPLNVRRFGLISDGLSSHVSLVPLHGISETWQPMLAGDKTFYQSYPGYITTKDGNKADDADLDSLREQIRGATGLSDTDITTEPIGEHDAGNLFAKLIKGQLPTWKWLDNKEYSGFLTPFPNTPGYSVLIPKRHLASDILAIDSEPFEALMRQAWSARQMLQKGTGARAVGIIFEGFEIDWAHVKLIPIRPGPDVGPVAEFTPIYLGFLTSQRGPQMTSDARQEAGQLANKLRQASTVQDEEYDK